MQPSLRSFCFVVCLATTVVACSRTTTHGTPEAGPPVSSTAAAPDASTPVAVAQQKVDPREAEILTVVKRWNDALATRKVTDLFDGEEQKVDPALVRKMIAACAK